LSINNFWETDKLTEKALGRIKKKVYLPVVPPILDSGKVCDYIMSMPFLLTSKKYKNE